MDYFKKFILLFLVFTTILLSCVPLEPAKKQSGIIKNYSYRKLYVICFYSGMKNQDSSLFLRNGGSDFIVLPKDSEKMYYSKNEIGSRPAIWKFNYYDWDTLEKYFHNFSVFDSGVAKKAFLKSDTVTREELLTNSASLIYK